MECADCPFYNLTATFGDGSETLSYDVIKSFPVLSPPHDDVADHDNEATLMRRLKKHPAPKPAPQPTEAPTLAPTAPTMAPTVNQTDSNAFHTLPSIKKGIGFQWLYVFCLSFAGVYVLYQYYKWSNRRQRIMRSEQAGNMLGDLQMLPSDDLSGRGAYQDHDDDDNHHDGYKDEEDHHDDDNDDHNGTKPMQII